VTTFRAAPPVGGTERITVESDNASTPLLLEILAMAQKGIEVRLALDTSAGSLIPGADEPVASSEYERKVFETPGVLEALGEALQEAEALRRAM
jgi:hypothetical protein